MMADMEISLAFSQSTMFPLVELPNHGTLGKTRSNVSQTGLSFPGSNSSEWIWKHTVGEPFSLHQLLNWASSFSNVAASLNAKILFFISGSPSCYVKALFDLDNISYLDELWWA